MSNKKRSAKQRRKWNNSSATQRLKLRLRLLLCRDAAELYLTRNGHTAGSASTTLETAIDALASTSLNVNIVHLHALRHAGNTGAHSSLLQDWARGSRSVYAAALNAWKVLFSANTLFADVPTFADVADKGLPMPEVPPAAHT